MSNKRFGIKEVADVTFYELNEQGYPGNPVICLDTLKVSNIEQTADQTDTKGGKGSSPLIIWDHSKEVTLTLQDAILSHKTLEIMYGNQENGIITISASTFPKTYYIEGSTFARDLKTGKDQIFKFIIPKAKVVSENTITMEAEGDPTVFDIKLRALRDTDGNMLRLILVPENSKGLAYEECDGGYKVTGIGTCEDTDIVIPNFYNNEPVIAIGAEAFVDSPIESVNIPSNVVEIEADAFNGCENLKAVNLSNGLKTIGACAFAGTQIKSIIIPNSVTYIDYGVFITCANLKAITIPKNAIIADPTCAFQGCSALETVNILSELSSIGENMFEDCSSLKTVVISNGAASIDARAFSGCSSLVSISIPNSVTAIGEEAFVNCSSLASISIPNGVTLIGDGAFRRCYALTSIDLPDSIDSIGRGAFYACNGLTSIDLPKNIVTIRDETFAWCSSLASIIIPDSVISIEDMAFWECSSLEKLSIGSGVTTIGSSAFEACPDLDEVIIPSNVTTIDEGAFYGSYTNVYVCGPENSISGAPWGAGKVVWDYTPS